MWQTSKKTAPESRLQLSGVLLFCIREIQRVISCKLNGASKPSATSLPTVGISEFLRNNSVIFIVNYSFSLENVNKDKKKSVKVSQCL